MEARPTRGEIAGGTRAGRLVLASMLVFAALLAGPVGARASVTMTSFTMTPSTTVAGAHPNVTVAANFKYSDVTDDLKRLQVNLPAGLLGNPNAVSKCSSA
jgi:hypothetical protein